MSTLIICLPQVAFSPAVIYDYALTGDGLKVANHAMSPPALLPVADRGGEVVVVVPVAMLSWHIVELPKGVGAGSPRLRVILDGLLEDQLLDESENLHFALAPGATTGLPVWVAACDKAWLRGHLQALEQAQHRVSRIVPEFAPETGPLQLHALGQVDLPQLVVLGGVGGGVMLLPLTSAALAVVPGPATPDEEVVISAEPSVAELAEHLLQRKVSLVTRQQRWLDAARSTWDLGQFDLASSGRARTFKRLSGLGRELWQVPAWRPARWGVVLVLLSNLIGMNVLAWKEQSELQARRDALLGTLTQTFPGVKVVIDAPLQMEREVAALRLATGAASGRDMEALLAALGSAAPADRSASNIDFAAGELRIKGLQLNAQEMSSLVVQLKGQGYSAKPEAEAVVIKQELVP